MARVIAPSHLRRRIASSVVSIVVAATTGAVALGGGSPVQAVDDHDWLGVVNTYRAMSGLDPVVENATWSAQAQAHSCYMLQNGISHDEIPGKPGYTEGGDIAGNSGNVAVSSAITATPRDHIDLWMTGPFHAIGILRHNLATSGFGLCANSSTPTWRSGGTLDVIRGLDGGRPRPSRPIVFPGDGATVPLSRFVTEFPNPMEMCGWTGSAGLPLIAMLPDDVSSATATLSGPGGPIPTCTLHAGNTSGIAESILDGDNAVVVMPRAPLVDGTHHVTVSSNGGTASWSFDVDQDGPLEMQPPVIPDTEPTAGETRFDPTPPFRLVDSRHGTGTVRLRAGAITRIEIGGPDVLAVSANFVAVSPDGFGFVTAYNCTTELPTVSTLGYRPGQTVANQAIVPLQDGDLCLYSLVSTDIVVDVNGYFRAGEGSGFTPVTPSRLLDSRSAGVAPLRAGERRVLRVAGAAGGAPAGATGVALNVTAVEPSAIGWLQVYPCGSANEMSSINYVAGEYRPNSVVTPVDGDGRICLRSLRDTDVIVDLTGFFAEGDGLDFQPLAPVRLFDSRSGHRALNESTNGSRVRGGQVVRLPIAGERGVPTDAKAVSVNVTATEASAPTFLTAYPCGARPDTSNVNVLPWQVVSANGAMLKLSSGGELCIYSRADVHVIVDINGVWR